MPGPISRRTILAATALAAARSTALGQGLASARRALGFQVWRGGQQIGSHTVSFEASGDDITAHIHAELVVKLGPIPVFRYRHDALEHWRGGRFVRLESHTSSNGKREQVVAEAAANGVLITTGAGGAPVRAPGGAHPLTHWNPSVLEGPLFNPQTGAQVHGRVERTTGQSVRLADGRSLEATRYALAGDAEIIDWYDAEGAWAALRGRAPDASYIDYRREA